MGLENSKIFTILMITGVLSISALIAVITYVSGSADSWDHDSLFPQGFPGVRLINFHSLLFGQKSFSFVIQIK